MATRLGIPARAFVATIALVFVSMINTCIADAEDVNPSTDTLNSSSEEPISFQTPAPPIAARRCYVCGPRAVQPHRSRRPPTCQGFTEPGGLVEDCDRGYNYCAIDVTFEPHIVESRMCVQQYDVQCKTRICKTTNMTAVSCSCQGDLCNGHIDGRVSAAINNAAGFTRRERQAKTEIPEHLQSKASEANETTTIAMKTIYVKKETTSTIASTAPASILNKTKSFNNIFKHTQEKDSTQIMSDDPHSHAHNHFASGETGTNHETHGTSLDYDEETEDDEEGSGRAVDTESRGGKRQQNNGNRKAEADKRQATSTTTLTPPPNGGHALQTFSSALIWTLVACVLY